MNISPKAPKRPALRYYGGKWDLAKWIIRHFPPHDHYVEPCFGAGSVFLQKSPVKLETVNDTNGRVVNYFRILRDQPGALIEALDLTPWSIDEYNLSDIVSGDPVEDARRFHILCWMSINGGPVRTGFRHQLSIHSRYATPATDLLHHDLWAVARRLKNLQILNTDALDLIAKIKDKPDPLIYFDPPYVKEKRSNKNSYGSNDQNNEFHYQAAKLLKTVVGHVVVSGYACPLYKEVYEKYGWQRIDKEAQTNGGKRVESLWLSPRTYAALQNDISDLPLFRNEK